MTHMLMFGIVCLMVVPALTYANGQSEASDYMDAVEAAPEYMSVVSGVVGAAGVVAAVTSWRNRR